MNFSSERLFHLADTYEILSAMPGISFKKWSYDKARFKIFCELVYAQASERSRALIPGGDKFQQQADILCNLTNVN